MIDPIILSIFTAVPNLVGLMCNYINEGRYNETQEAQEFLDYLAQNKQDELLASLNRIHGANISIKALLFSANKNTEIYLSEITKELNELKDTHEGLGEQVDLILEHIVANKKFDLTLDAHERILKDRLESEHKHLRELYTLKSKDIHKKNNLLSEEISANELVIKDLEDRVDNIQADYESKINLLEETIDELKSADKLFNFSEFLVAESEAALYKGDTSAAKKLIDNVSDEISQKREALAKERESEDFQLNMAEAKGYFISSKIHELDLMFQDSYSSIKLAVSLSPDNVNYLTSAVNLSLILGLPLEAISFSDNLFKLNDKSDEQLENGELAKLYNQYGRANQDLGDHDKALRYFQLAFDINDSTDKNRSDASAYYNNMGGVFHTKGDYFNAIKNYNQSLIIDIDLYGKNHSRVAASQNNLAAAYDDLGEYEKAISIYNEALGNLLMIFGENHPLVCTCKNNIASIFFNQGDTETALDLFKTSLIGLKKCYGEVHPLIALTCNNIGECHRNLENFPEAIKNYNFSLDLFNQLYAGEHPNVSSIYNNLGIVYRELKNFPLSMEYLNKALKIDMRRFSVSHPKVATILSNIGITYKHSGDPREAITYYQRAMESNIATFGEVHPLVSNRLHSIGTAFLELEDLGAALNYYQRALNMRLETLGGMHPETMISIQHVMYVESEIKKIEKN
jgi:tetratricopeptide (TPR) repeat protein